ncbi:MAG TPA: RNA degradosome polyphosphate kinase, partial [Arthrobacter sp.]|nr:RNA degradosome polyphosphate kinase [Arthrobacter sp.]
MQRDSARTATSGAATPDAKPPIARAQFGSSEVPASRATQDRIDIPEFAPSIEPAGDFSPDRFLDRELSWLSFNARVLELAEDPDLHLLERVGFLSIFASNLDEFFMVRVAGLKRRIATGLAVPSPAGLSPVQVLEQIGDEAHRLQQRHARVYAEQIRPALAYEHIHLMHWDDLDSQAQDQLSAMFAEKVFPILTPLAVDPAHPFPYISGLSLNLAVVVRNPVSDKELFARLKVPDQLPRLISVDGPRAGSVPGRVARFIALEEVIAVHLDQLFAGMEVLEHHTFRVTRNEDLEVEEDDAENLLQALEKELLRRRFG